MRVLRIVVATVSVGVMSCASLFTGTSQILSFNSSPNGAEVLVDGAPVGVTPLSTKIPKSDSTVVRVRKDGYEAQEFTLQTSMEPWFLGNIILGGLVGSTTDVASGAVNRYAPSAYFITLTPVEASPEARSEFLERRRLRNFALTTYGHLGRELGARHPGEYVGSLLLLRRDLTVQGLSAMYFAPDNAGPVAFAEAVAAK